MFRHARQLDLARRLNHADRKERILISLRDESRDSSREIPLSPRDVASSYFFLSPPPPLISFAFQSSLRPYYETTTTTTTTTTYRPISFSSSSPYLPSNPEAKGPNCFFSFSPSYNYQQRNALEFSPFFSADKSCNEENATFPDDSLRTNFSPPPFANRITTIVVRVILIIIRRSRHIETYKKKIRKGIEKNRSIDISSRLLGDIYIYIYIPGDISPRGKWTNAPSLPFPFSQEEKSLPPPFLLAGETLPTIRVIELFRPSFSSYGDAMKKKKKRGEKI